MRKADETDESWEASHLLQQRISIHQLIDHRNRWKATKKGMKRAMAVKRAMALKRAAKPQPQNGDCQLGSGFSSFLWV